jgi:hypothetical protein
MKQSRIPGHPWAFEEAEEGPAGGRRISRLLEKRLKGRGVHRRTE